MRTVSYLFIVAAAVLALAVIAAPLHAEDADIETAKAIEKDLVGLVQRVSKAYVMIGGGSGVVITPDGWMLTNDHVIAQFRKKTVWHVMLPMKKRYVADLIGKDVTGDIALLKIRGETNLPYVPLGNSDALEPGDLVVALGNPFSHAFRTAEPTVTFGIVSATHNNQWTYSDAIQTDAPLNPGNSGGPLINLKGELVGINGRVRVRFWKKYNTGVGLAIPTSQIERFLPHLKKGDVRHGHITGLGFDRVDVSQSDLVVNQVRQGTVAERAGFKQGDKIIAVDGMEAWNQNRFEGIIHAYPSGAKVRISVEREGKTVELTAELQDWFPGGGPAVIQEDTKPGLGVKVSDETPITGGAEITEVQVGSAASRAGLKEGDVILAFDGKQVQSPKDLDRLIKAFYEDLNDKREQTPMFNPRRETTVRVQRGIEELGFRVEMGPEP